MTKDFQSLVRHSSVTYLQGLRGTKSLDQEQTKFINAAILAKLQSICSIMSFVIEYKYYVNDKISQEKVLSKFSNVSSKINKKERKSVNKIDDLLLKKRLSKILEENPISKGVCTAMIIYSKVDSGVFFP